MLTFDGRLGGVSRRALVVIAALGLATTVQADDWPSRPIKLVVGFPAGGSPDTVGRLVADKLTQRLGQSVIVESTVGAGGVLASDMVSRAAPDGYTMVMLTGAHSGTAATRKKLPYDPVDGFSMISLVTAYPMVVAVKPDSPIMSFPDLLARAKAAPDKITVGSNAPGSVHHLLSKWIDIEAGIATTAVPYRGDSQAILDVLGGRIDVMIGTATALLDQSRAGAVRPLALSSPQRYALLPDVPTIAESLPGVETMSWLGLALPPKTPQPIVDRLNREIRDVLALPEIKERFAQLGGVPSPSSSAEMVDLIRREVRRWSVVVEQKHIERQ